MKKLFLFLFVLISFSAFSQKLIRSDTVKFVNVNTGDTVFIIKGTHVISDTIIINELLLPDDSSDASIGLKCTPFKYGNFDTVYTQFVSDSCALGTSLVMNGDFSTGGADWDADDGGVNWLFAGGFARLRADTLLVGILWQELTNLLPATDYRIQFRINDVDIDTFLMYVSLDEDTFLIINKSDIFDTTITTAGALTSSRLRFECTGLHDLFTIGIVELDNVFVRDTLGGLWRIWDDGLITHFTSSNTIEIGDSSMNVDPAGNVTVSRRFTLIHAVWDDLRFPASGLQLPQQATDPTFDIFRDGVRALMFASGADDMLWFDMQLPHGYVDGTDIYPHIHWSPMNTNTDTLTWGLEYSIANVGEIYPATDTIYVKVVPSGVTYFHEVADFPVIDGSGIIGLSTMVKCRIFRDVNGADTNYNTDAALQEIDFHIQLNEIGSQERESD